MFLYSPARKRWEFQPAGSQSSKKGDEMSVDTNVHYTINLLPTGVLKIGFVPNTSADNNQLVVEAQARLDEMIASGELAGGEIIRVNGPASLPVAMVVCHKLAHLYGAVACFDPKLATPYVVAVAHGGKYTVGDLVGE